VPRWINSPGDPQARAPGEHKLARHGMKAAGESRGVNEKKGRPVQAALKFTFFLLPQD
jgi:hypothetical protein